MIAFLLLGIIYDSVTPIFEAGDEQFHYPYIKHIADGHGLPLQDPAVKQPWRQEGSQPPLYYVIGALATFWIDTSDAAERLTLNPHAIIGVPAHDTNDNRNMLVHTSAESFPYQRTTLAVHLVRWLSLLMGAGTIYAVYRLTLRLTQREATAFFAAALVAFNPMFAFLSAAVNNDNAVILLATLGAWQMVRIWQDGVTTRRVLALGVLLGLAAFAKISALGLIGVAGLMLWVKLWIDHGNARNRIREFAIRNSQFAIPILIIAGWWYARNFVSYGDLTGLSRMLAIVGTRQGTPQWLPLVNAELEGMRLSFWGLFGGVNILAAPWVYTLLMGVTEVGRIGMSLFMLKFLWDTWRAHDGEPSFWRRLRMRISQLPLSVGAYAWLVVWVVVLLFAWMRWTLVTPATQGRLIFPALATIVIALAVGWTLWLPRRIAPYVSGLLAVALLVIALRVALVDIAPTYTPAPLVTQVPASAARVPIRFGDAMEMVGVEMPQTAAHAGDTLDVTLYWRAVTPMQTNYSVFVHLLDAGDLIVGQRDSYPGLGLRPTTQLRAGDIVRDVYRLSVDAAAITPSEPQVRVGVYDFATGARLPSAQGDNPAIGTISLLPSVQGGAPNPVAFNFESYFTLMGYQIDGVAVRAGEAFTLTLVWRANGTAPKDYSIFTHVLGTHDALWGQMDRQLPTRAWQNGQVITDVYVIQVKPDTPSDVYDIELGAYDLGDNFKRLGVWGADGQFVGDRVLLRKVRVLGR